ncbi:hypothetical protein ACQJBY_018266 [Aegilops geniculata]
MEPVGSSDGSGELSGIGSGKRKGIGSGKRKGIGSGKRKGIGSGKRKEIGPGMRKGTDMPEGLLRSLLFRVLKTRIKNQLFSRLRNIDDQYQRLDALRVFETWAMYQIGASSQILSRRTDDLYTRVVSLAEAISSKMVVQFVQREEQARKQEELSVCALASCSKEVRHMWRHFPRYEQNLTLLSKVQSVSTMVDVLRRLEPDLHHTLRLMEVEEVSEDHLECKLRSMELKVDEEEMGKDDEAAGMLVEGFDTYRSCWESSWSPARNFEDLTLASSMIFTHCTPVRIPRDAIVGNTLQIYSVKVKVADLQDFKSPLKVYGVVAARDTVDSSRNPIFLRSRNDCQILNLQDPFLHLNGPSRAIVCMAPVDIEIELKLKGGTKSEDITLISKVYHYSGERLGMYLVEDVYCGIELRFQQLKHSVQATISRVRLVERGSTPFPHGGRVACFSELHEQSKETVLVDTKGETMAMGKHRCLELTRRVVSVELDGRLRVVIQAYTTSGETISSDILFTPQKCGATKSISHIGESMVEVTVAWSLLPSPKKDLPCPLPRIC